MKTLVIVAHPDLEQSRVNRTWTQKWQQAGETVTVQSLYAKYPDGVIDGDAERLLVEEHDRLVFQFPFYWYSSPALLKRWQDDVLAFGWAYGAGGDKLKGKELLLVVSTGGGTEAYQPDGYNVYTMEQLLVPFRAMARLTGMVWLEPHLLQGVRHLSDEQLARDAETLIKRVVAG